MSRATLTLDYFPSLAQLKEICDYMQGMKPAGSSHGRPKFKDDDYIAPADRRISPWPPALEALMLQISAGNMNQKGWMPALIWNNLNEDESWRLYEYFVAMDFNAPTALALVEKTKVGDPQKRLREYFNFVSVSAQ